MWPREFGFEHFAANGRQIFCTIVDKKMKKKIFSTILKGVFGIKKIGNDLI